MHPPLLKACPLHAFLKGQGIIIPKGKRWFQTGEGLLPFSVSDTEVHTIPKRTYVSCGMKNRMRKGAMRGKKNSKKAPYGNDNGEKLEKIVV